MAENNRPRWHYTPPSGWINDPNGLHWDGRQWHLFAQHTPYSDARPATPGDMYWLHAVSDDLIRWRDLGIALSPDALGVIYSGSAVMDGGTTAAFFTHHGACEQQSVAFSQDGVNYEKYAGNPVIANPGLQDFRDPKVFRNSVLGGWSMVLAAGGCLHFYQSVDLLQWKKTGEFGKEENQMGDIFECPDLFPLSAPDGRALWVLTASMGISAFLGGGKMQYFLGEFDGRSFYQTVQPHEPLRVDAGQDYYAAVSFFNAEPMQIGWAGNWAYAAQLPSEGWRGCMSLARKLKLTDTKLGMRLSSQPMLPRLRVHCTAGEGNTALPGDCFVLDIEAAGDFSAAFINNSGESFRFGCKDDVFYTDREKAGNLPYPQMNQPRMMDGSIHMRVIFDHSVIEIFADSGTFSSTSLVLPSRKFEALALFGAKAIILIDAL